MPAPGLSRSDEREVAELVADAERLRRPPSCRRTAREGHGASRFECRADERRWSVSWQHYGTGRYVIESVGRGGRSRVVARGVLTINQ